MASEPPEDLQPSSAYLDRVLAAERILSDAREAVERGNVPPVYLADQMTAAAKDARDILEFIGEVDGQAPVYTGPVRTQKEAERMALIVAGIIGTQRCSHLNAVPIQPAQCILGMRRTLCLACTGLVRPRDIVVPDDACDLCEAQPVHTFRAVTFQLGAIVLVGNICDGCNSRLEESA